MQHGKQVVAGCSRILKAERFGRARRLGNGARQGRKRSKAGAGRAKHAYLEQGDAKLQAG